MSEEGNVTHINAEQMLQSIVNNHDLFKKLLECLPYPVQVYAPDGTLIMVNQSFLEEFDVPDPSLIIGKSNILHDHPVDEYDVIQNVLAGFAGKATYVNELKIPVHNIKKFYNIPAKNVEAFYLDISTLPLKDDSGEILCVVNIFITRRKLIDSLAIAKAKSYIEAHWQNEFHGDEVAKDVYISPSHFLRLFKAHTGMTPHDYYINVKINKLKDKLLDINLSIEEAFAECGIHYHGHYAELFKKKTGLTPSEYRKLAQK
jgi:AraC-like DNA-binding protein